MNFPPRHAKVNQAPEVVIIRGFENLVAIPQQCSLCVNTLMKKNLKLIRLFLVFAAFTIFGFFLGARLLDAGLYFNITGFALRAFVFNGFCQHPT